MIRSVFDCNVLIAGIGWGGLSRACLDLVIGGQAVLCLTPEVWAEYDRRIPEILSAKKSEVDPRPTLDLLLRLAHFVDPAPLGKRRSRDVKDDPYLSAALGAGAPCVVTNDRDLLDLGKPFGVAMLTPVEFIKWVRAPGLV
ncbi:MAG TPA: PIN domain-containing protein [Verrucomicrobiota bacterium]|nr:PIN domain-containing protein [Verrucomicrobiota bacterium]HNU50649.1 PIN domain-containing protein [Verrucomicrobiota bacterium]